MDTLLLNIIDELIDASRDELARMTIELVNIRSVAEDPLPGAPFGAGPRRVLDKMLEWGHEEGFACTDYNVGVISLAEENKQPDLGIWLHGDVVHEGEGWNFDPYNAVEYKGCIIGRGATDNKGQIAAIFQLLKLFRKLGIKLKYNPALYIGSNEETGMKDIIGIPGNPDARGFINVCTPPRISLVPDSGFPVGYGGKGGLNLTLRSKSPLHGFTLTAGLKEAPGRATAVFESATLPDELPRCTVTKDGATTVFTETPPVHGAHPNPNGNMITLMSEALLGCDAVATEDRYILEFAHTLSLDIHGKFLGIDTPEDPQHPLTVFAHRITCDNDGVTVFVNIRYPAVTNVERIVDGIRKVSEAHGFTVDTVTPGVSAYVLDPDGPILKTLCDVANSVTGDNAKPFYLSGGTYAHRLPNGYAFGMSGNLPPEDFPKGRGGAHGVDECVSLARLQRAMRIYARALLALNEMDW